MRSCVFALLVLLAPYSAMAQGQPRPQKTLSETLTGDAKAAYDAGKLLFGDGDYAGAEIKFKAAYDASGDARLLWNMAACEKSQRHYARTESLVREYVEKGGALLTEQDRADAKALLETIDSFTVKLTVTVNEEGAEVFVDDVSVGKTPLPKPVVVDIGARKIAVRKDGFKDFEQQVPVGGAATAKLDVKLEPRLHEGKVDVVTQPNAEIFLDGAKVGTGRWSGKVKSGGHTLRVVAAGMRPYQSEIVVSDDESRTIDVPLDREVLVEKAKEKPWAPGGEIAVSTGPGVKLHGSGAALYDLRAEIGWKPGWPTELALTVDLGSMDASNNCAFDVQGPTGAPGSIDPRFSFQSCLWVRPGLAFAVHFLPKSRLDPYVEIESGFRFLFVGYKYYSPVGVPPPTQIADAGSFFPGIDSGGRVGLDWTPFEKSSRFRLGAYVSALVALDQETVKHNTNIGPGFFNNDKGPAVYPWLLFGLRSSLIF